MAEQAAALIDQHAPPAVQARYAHVAGVAAAGCGDLARGAIEHLKQHRLKREAKIVAAMQTHPEGTLDDWVAHAYDDTPERLWPVAKRSLMAHLERIEALGLVQ